MFPESNDDNDDYDYDDEEATWSASAHLECGNVTGTLFKYVTNSNHRHHHCCCGHRSDHRCPCSSNHHAIKYKQLSGSCLFLYQTSKLALALCSLHLQHLTEHCIQSYPWDLWILRHLIREITWPHSTRYFKSVLWAKYLFVIQHLNWNLDEKLSQCYAHNTVGVAAFLGSMILCNSDNSILCPEIRLKYGTFLHKKNGEEQEKFLIAWPDMFDKSSIYCYTYAQRH